MMWLSIETAIVVEASKSPARLAILRICYPLITSGTCKCPPCEDLQLISSFSPSILVNFSVNLAYSIYDELFMTQIPGLPEVKMQR